MPLRVRGWICMLGGWTYLYLNIENVSNRTQPPHVERKKNLLDSVNRAASSPRLRCFCLTLVALSCLFQCMRNPALLQRTGSAIRVFCHIQDNVWLLRWICRCWRHHGQLLGGKEPPRPHPFWCYFDESNPAVQFYGFYRVLKRLLSFDEHCSGSWTLLMNVLFTH